MVDGKTLELYRNAVTNPPYMKDIFERPLPNNKAVTVEEFLLSFLNAGDERSITAFEKIMLANRLPVDGKVRQSMVSNLGKNYGFKNAGDPSKENIDKLDWAVREAIGAEYFGLDPREIISKEDELKAYMTKHLGKSDLYDEYPTSKVIGFCVKALKISKVYECAKDKHKEADEIRKMSSDEWLSYSHGIKWSQMARANDVDQEGYSIEQELSKSIASHFGYEFRGKKLDKVIPIFQNAPIVKDALSQYAVEFEMFKLMVNDRMDFLDSFTISRKKEVK